MGCYGMGVNRIVAALSNQERPKKFKDSDLIGIPPYAWSSATAA
jgi:hypothetical protein